LPGEIDHDSQVKKYVVIIGPSTRQHVALTSEDVFNAQKGLIMPAYIDLPKPSEEAPHVCLRKLNLLENDTIKTEIEIEEDLGDSIARRVWDAAIVTLSLIAQICLRKTPNKAEMSLPTLRGILQDNRDLNIIELGSGVGTLGIGLAKILLACPPDRSTRVSILLTDLPEAEERTLANISRCQNSIPTRNEDNFSLEYENLDWNDAKAGRFGSKVRSRTWDLIVISDCTYNVDSIPLLVDTLSAFHSRSQALCGCTEILPRVILATKPRHESEKIFFDLMSDQGWKIRENLTLPLPVLNADTQSVEVYLFEK
jgi:hypothetical protein